MRQSSSYARQPWSPPCERIAPLRRLLGAWLQSCIGTGLGYVALILLTVRHLHTSWAVSAVLLTDFLPSIVLGPWLGALADRYPKRAPDRHRQPGPGRRLGGLRIRQTAAMILGLRAACGHGGALTTGPRCARAADHRRRVEPACSGDVRYLATGLGSHHRTAPTGGRAVALGRSPAACDQRGELRDRRGRDRDASDSRARATEDANDGGELGRGVRAGFAAAFATPASQWSSSPRPARSSVEDCSTSPSRSTRACAARQRQRLCALVASYCLGMVAATVLVAHGAGAGPGPVGRYIAAPSS